MAMIMHERGIIESLDQQAKAAGPADIQLCMALRRVANRFCEWSKVCEPGWLFNGMPLHIFIVRLATCAPIYGTQKRKTEIVPS